jgi:hypothetical protein
MHFGENVVESPVKYSSFKSAMQKEVQKVRKFLNYRFGAAQN